MADHSNELVVVAIPARDDYVWRVSSETVPHLTILYLGKPALTPTELAQVTGYIEHASSQLERFMLDVERRGELGDKNADVLFFEKRWAKRIEQFRSHLLQNELINRAYHSVEQYPEWTPHLTMGYPEKPAKKDDREYNRFSYVQFDKISLWTGNSVGPTFELKDDDLEVARMSDISLGQRAAEQVIAHYGVKGMRWGVRKARKAAPNSADAARTQKIKSRVKTIRSTKTLSNKELKDAIERMRLEQDFSKLSKGLDKTKTEKAKDFVTDLIKTNGKQHVNQLASNEFRNQVESRIRQTKK